MSDFGVAEQQSETTGTAGVRVKQLWLTIMLALVLAVPVLVLISLGHGTVPFWVLIVSAVFSFAGLLAVFGFIAGVVHVGWLPKQRVFFDAMFDAIADGCVVTDRRGRVIYANKVYRDLAFKSRPGRLIGIENLYSGYPEISDRVYRLAQAARDGYAQSEEFRLSSGNYSANDKDREPAWIRVQVVPIELTGRKGYTLWRHKDISEDRREQEGAFSHLQYIINYLDHAPAGFFSATNEGRIEYINGTLSEWLGLDLSQSVGGNLQLSDLVNASTATLLSRAKPTPNGSLTEVMSVEMTCQNGDSLPVKIIHRRDFDENGLAKPSRSLILHRELPSLEDDQDKTTLESRLDRMIAVAPVGIAKVDANGKILTMNPAFANFSESALRGGPLVEIAIEGQRQQLGKSFADVVSGKSMDKPFSIDLDGKETDATGGTGTADVLICLDDPEAGSKGGITVFVVDTSKRSSLEVQLAQSQKMQAVGQLAGGVAHDFNNVLTAIIGFSDLLLNKHRPTDPAFADIMNIRQNANRAANLVRQLLAFSRRQTLRPEVMSLTDAVSDLGNLLGRLLGETVELNVLHGRDMWLVKIDVNQFEQVVINLAVNARDAMADGGTLSVRTRNVAADEAAVVAPRVMPSGEYVLLEMSDTGSGMPASVVEKIYEPFFSTKDVGKGTGLGLSTVYGIVKQTGGFIFCDSREGVGTTFRIYLPRYEPSEAEKEAAKTEKLPDASHEDLTGKGTILLVEDEDAVRSFASRALQTRGYTVLEANTGENALEIVEEQGGNIDLVLSDVVMPEMDGPSMLKELRKRGVTTKVVFISGYAEDAFEKNLEGHDDFAFLPKPFSLKQLAEAVKDAMGK